MLFSSLIGILIIFIGVRVSILVYDAALIYNGTSEWDKVLLTTWTKMRRVETRPFVSLDFFPAVWAITSQKSPTSMTPIVTPHPPYRMIRLCIRAAS